MYLHPRNTTDLVNAWCLSKSGKSTPFSVVFGFRIDLSTPIEELIKSIRGRTTFVTFRDL